MAIQKVQIIGVPSDLGAGRRGVDMGPSAIRYARLYEEIHSLNAPCEDWGNLDVVLAEKAKEGKPNLRHLESVVDVSRRVRDEMLESLKEGALPLLLGGDHSLSIGTLAAVCTTWKKPGVLWIDAHGDFNTPQTTPSGNIHGMALAVGTGRGAPELLELFAKKFVDPSRIALIGVRSLDQGERDLLKDSGVAVFTMYDIDRRGLHRVLDEALRQVAARTDGVHVSFDMDVIDPNFAPGVGTPVLGGLSYREAHLLMESIAESELMRSLEVVEVNPILDERNQTGRLAVELIASALGKRIF